MIHTSSPSVAPEFLRASGAEAALQTPGTLRALWDRLKRDRVATVALVLLGLIIVVCILAPFTSPHDPFATDAVNRLEPPGSAGHVLGTDGEGRDLLSRLIWGGRISLLTGIVPVLIGLVVGGIFGLIAGYYGGVTRTVIMRCVDILFAFPAVLLAIAIAVTLGPGTRNVIIALAVVLIPSVARVTESATITACSQEYIEAAKASGVHDVSIIVTQLVRNVASAPLAYCFSIIGPVIVFAAGLNFLGLGIQPPDAEWGSMLYALQSSLLLAPLTSVVPGIPIAVAALLFDIIGNAVRDVLDPRLA
ncbi:MAG TPA: ABC transporter permease [Candidatus Dormibacteraeota bacterium]